MALPDSNITIRRATRADVPAIVGLLADDALGRAREQLSDPLPASYYAAFEAIDADPSHELAVVDLGGAVVGTLQLTFLPGLSHRGGTRALVEAVRVAGHLRGQGIGQQLMEWAIDRARERGCFVVQLTSHLSRSDAHRFYERLGFAKTHAGMKLELGG